LNDKFLKIWSAFFIALLLSCPAVAQLAFISVAELSPQAQQTLEAIGRGGPYAYPKDGVVFGNYEKLLPLKKRGYYREYTVKTPYARNRGARRIITGGDPAHEYFYTDDHYASFRRIQR
jgi:ribonuclease T1